MNKNLDERKIEGFEELVYWIKTIIIIKIILVIVGCGLGFLLIIAEAMGM